MITPNSLYDLKKMIKESHNKDPDIYDGAFLLYNDTVIGHVSLSDKWYFNSRESLKSMGIDPFSELKGLLNGLELKDPSQRKEILIKDSEINCSDIPELDNDFWVKAELRIPEQKSSTRWSTSEREYTTTELKTNYYEIINNI